jgi:uncharacterized protein YjbI with pentapeptide repeats
MEHIVVRALAEEGVVGAVVHEGDYVDLRALVEHCAANGITLPRVDLSGANLDDANLTGLQAPGASLTGASCRRVKALGPAPLVLAAAQLQGSVWDDADLRVANLACTHPTSFARVRVSAQTDLSGCDWSDCSDKALIE